MTQTAVEDTGKHGINQIRFPCYQGESSKAHNPVWIRKSNTLYEQDGLNNEKRTDHCLDYINNPLVYVNFKKLKSEQIDEGSASA